MAHVHVKHHPQHARSNHLRVYEYAAFAVLAAMAAFLVVYFLVLAPSAMQQISAPAASSSNAAVANLPASAPSVNTMVKRADLGAYWSMVIPNTSSVKPAAAVNTTVNRVDLGSYWSMVIPNTSSVITSAPASAVNSIMNRDELRTYWQYFLPKSTPAQTNWGGGYWQFYMENFLNR